MEAARQLASESQSLEADSTSTTSNISSKTPRMIRIRPMRDPRTVQAVASVLASGNVILYVPTRLGRSQRRAAIRKALREADPISQS
jgi:hypothetical protein